MRKYFLIAALIFLYQRGLVAQTSDVFQEDSLFIDRLQKKLPTLRDTARINCLNELGKAFIYRRGYDLKTKSDSAYPYAIKAYAEATESKYKYGLAYSLVNLCYVYYMNVASGKLSSADYNANLNKWTTYQNQLLELAKQINDPELLGQAYSPLYSVLLASKNKSKESVAAAEMALGWYRISGNQQTECEISQSIGYQYFIDGEYEKAFDYFNRSLQLAKKNNSKPHPDDWSYQMLQWGLRNMSDLFQTAGDYESALNFLRQSKDLHTTRNTWNTEGMEEELADLFLKSAQVDSAFYYLKPLFIGPNPRAVFQWPILADAYLMTGKPDSALKYYNLAIDTLKTRVKDGYDPTILVRCYNGKAKVLGMRHDYKNALSYAKKGYSYATRTGNKSNILDGYDLLSQFFHELGKGDSAYFYLRQYIKLKDSTMTRQFFWRLNNYKNAINEAKKEAEIGFLNRDSKIKQEQLKQEAQLKKFLVIGLLLVILAGFFVVRNLSLTRKNEQLAHEKTKTQLQQKVSELEMQALRAQMNPHFIFNCLSSINRFILKNETDDASDYLTRFSRLIRMVLINSKRSLVTLEDEVEMLRLYLDMERMRFKYSFDYNIIYSNTVDSGSIQIPPMILQPFCENAIWHGLMNKERDAKLNVSLSASGEVLNCIIEDNGIGRKKAGELKSKSREDKTSLGLKITEERLALLHSENSGRSFYKIEDLYDDTGNPVGTRVILRISVKESAAVKA